jgi:DNA-binding NarL/FixJ family response regulator
MLNNKTIVYIADHNTIMRNALGLMIHRIKPGTQVLGFKTFAEINKTVNNEHPDLIIYEAGHKFDQEQNKIKKLNKKFPGASILLMFDQLNSLSDKQKSQFEINGQFEKRAPIREIEKLISQNIDGEENPVNLTRAERRLLSMIDSGYSAAKMAELLNLSPHTIKTHIYRMYKKFGVKNAISAIHVARTHGLLISSDNFGVEDNQIMI